MEHKCENCEKVFKRIYELDRHKIRKNKCVLKNKDVNISSSQNNSIYEEKNANNSINEEKTANNSNTDVTNAIINKLECKYCHKTYSRSDNLQRHVLNFCSVKNIQSALKTIVQQERKETDKKIEELQNTITELQTKIKTEPTSITTNNTINNTINNNITNNNNIVLKFGCDIDPSVISMERLAQILNQSVYKIVPNMVEEIHCNINHPKYHNIYISDKRSKEAIIFNGSKYVTAYADEVIEILDLKMKGHLSRRFYQIEDNDKFSEKDKKMIVERLEILNDVEEVSPEQKKSNQLTKHVLCDYRDTIKDTRRKVEKKQSHRKKIASIQTMNIPYNN